MCRWIMYFGNEVSVADAITKHGHGLVNVARSSIGVYTPGFEDEEQFDKSEILTLNHRTNGNGFGVGFYHANRKVKKPAVLRDCKPIWHSNNLDPIATFVRSPLVFGHVRWAEKGTMSEQNCHPFTHGVYMFMHNGDIWKFHKIKSAMLALITSFFNTVTKDHDLEREIKGTTDTEHMFWLILAIIAKKKKTLDFSEAVCTSKELMGCLQDAIVHILTLITKIVGRAGGGCLLNLCFSDGEKVIITRFRNTHSQPGSLYFTLREKNVLPHPTMRDKLWEAKTDFSVHVENTPICENFGFSAKSLPEVIIVASEPTEEGNEHLWKLVPRNYIVAIQKKDDHGLLISSQPMKISEDLYQYRKGVFYI